MTASSRICLFSCALSISLMYRFLGSFAGILLFFFFSCGRALKDAGTGLGTETKKDPKIPSCFGSLYRPLICSWYRSTILWLVLTVTGNFTLTVYAIPRRP